MIANIEKSNIEEIFDLNTAQKGMLFHYLKDEGNQFNVQIVLRIEGIMDIDLLEQSIRSIQANNEVLRSVFNWEIPGKPFQIILKEIPVELTVEHFFDKLTGELPSLCNRYLDQDRQRRFDLNGLPIRFGIIKCEHNSYLMHITHHHILYDGWSTGIILKEIFSAYDMLLQKSAPALIAKPSFKEIQKAIRVKTANSPGNQFWADYMEGYELANLSSMLSGKQEKEKLKTISIIDRELDIESFSAGNKVTKASIIYAAYGMLIQKYLYTSDIVFGTAVSYREGDMRNAENVVGNFINIIPLRLRGNGNLSLLETIMGVQADLIDRNAYNHTSYFDIRQMMGLQPSESLFDSVLVIENYPLDKSIKRNDRDYQVSLHSLYENTGMPLLVTVFLDEGLRIDYTYNIDRIPDELVSVLSSQLPLIIRSILNSPLELAGAVSILTEKERNEILYEFNNTEVSYPKNKTIVELFEKQVEKTPGKCAIFSVSESITYNELNKRINRLAHFLKYNGVKKGGIVGILMDRSIDFVINVFAVVKAGALYLPIDAGYPDERINYMLENSEANVLLTKEEILKGKNVKEGSVIFCYDKLLQELNALADSNPPAQEVEDIYVLYTSGSTGLPKGVVGTEKGLINRLYWGWDKYPINDDDVFCLKTNIGFGDHVVEMFSPLLSGTPVRVFGEEEILNITVMYSLLIREKITRITLVPTYLKALIDQMREEEPRTHALKYVFCSGEALPFQQAKDFYRVFHGVQLVNIYGSTEVSADATSYDVERGYVDDGSLDLRDNEIIDEPRNLYSKKIPIGKPISNTTAYILDENYNPVPIGVCGELYVGGSGVARGYLNNADLSSEKFVSDPYRKGDRMYRTGDLGRWRSDGTIEFLGRRDDQVKIRGHRIEPGEIAVHVNGYAGIGDAVVQVRERGGEKYLVCYYVSSDVIREDDLQEYLSFRLPEYMIPGRYIRLESIPLTSSGKVDRKKLPEPEIINVDNYIAPANAVEEKLVEIWSEVLQIDKGVISTDSGFFRLGGHSLKAMALANKISRQLHVEVPLKEIFLRQDIRGLCAFIQGSSNSGYSGISKADAAESYPLSSSQKRMYFLYEFDKLSVAYNMPVVLELEGELDLRRISGAFGGLISRHESLRTTFGSVNGQVAQRIHAASGFNLEWYESEGVDAGPVIRRFIRPFELERGPLFRAGVVRRGQSSHLLLVDMHHIITDGVSQGILIRDFMSLYNNEVLPELRLEYKDYSVWQQGPAQQERLLGQRDFWKGEFSEGVSLLNLPCDHPRPAVKSYQGSNRSFMLDAEDTSGLRQLGEGSGATLFMTVLSVFNVFLSKLSNEEDITVGTATAGRYHAELEGIIGLFVNTLALRNQATGSLSFREFLSVVKERTLSCFDNQLYPYEELINELELSRDTSRSPLFDVMFSYQNFGHKDLEIPGLKLKPGANEHNISKFDLTLTATETEGKLHLNFEYSTSLFEGETIDRFMSYFGLLVKAVIADADRSLSELDMLPEGERYQLLYGFNDTATDYPKDRTITDLFEEQVEKTPDHVAVVFKEEQLTYKALNEKSNQLARYLLSAGIVPGNVVGLLLNRSLEMAIGIIGILKAGAIYMPIEPSLPEQRIKYMLDQSGTRLLLTHDQYLGQNYTDCRVMDINSAAGYGGNKENLYVKTGPEDLAYCIFTSGSTGLPKGVMVGNQSVVNLVTGLEKKVYKYYNDKPLHVALLASCIFDVSLQPIFGSLLLGHCLYICDEQDRKDGNRLIDFYNNNDIDLSDGTPTHLRLVVESLDKKINLKSLSSWILAGEILPKELVREFYDRIGDREIKLFDFYGPTETCVYSTCFEIIRDELDAYPTIPIGSPLPNERIYITDKYGSLTPTGVAGELCIAGDGLAKCYVGNAGLTSEKFREDWISNGERVYRTGDLARWLPDGNIEYLGRTDSQVKIRGYRIELGEIESWLTGYEGIKNAVVLVKEKDENKYLAAYFISEKDIKPEMLRNYLAEHLPEYMLPAHYVRIDSMPLTSSGKIDRNAFPEIGLGTSDNYIAPVTREEQLLCEVWSRVLGVKRIGITDNFFSLGGDSIKSIQVCSRMRIAGYKVTVQEIFYNQTIDKLAVQLKGIEKVSDQTSVNGEVGLTGIQQKFFEGERLRKNHYNQSVMLNFQDRLTLDEVREIFGVIQDHHDALRMVYRGGEKQVVQYNRGPGQPVFVNYFDLQDNISPREKLYSISNELQSGIDLEQGPLLKLGLFDLIDGSRLLIVIHHLVTDGISWRILFEDIKTLYQQLKRGEILKLPPKTDSFKLWSQKLRSDYIGGKRYTSAVAYWTSILIQDGVDITSGNTVTENTIGEGANSGFRLEKSLTEKLLGEVHSTFNTQINDILLAGFLMSVNKHYGTGALQMDLEGHGREDIIPGMDMSRTIGWFTSVYPVVLKQTEDGLPGLIKSVKETLRGVPNKGIDYLIAKYLSGDIRSDASSRIIFNYLGQVDSDTGEEVFSIATESTGLNASPEEQREYAWDVSAIVTNDELHMQISYSISQYDQLMMDELMVSYKASLEELIAYCLSHGKRELTPSDLTYKGLTISQLEKLQDKLTKYEF